RLAAAELQVVGTQVQAEASELPDADLEGDPRSRRWLLEDHAQRAAGEQAMLLPLLLQPLQLLAEVEHRCQLAGAPGADAGEVAALQVLREVDHRPAKLYPWVGVEAAALRVVEGDITTLDVDAIANAANNHLWMGAGVAGAIKRAGGEEIEREAVAKGPIAVGDAVATGGGRLPARWVIHAAVMGQDLRTSADAISAATQRTLEVADELGAESLALPAFGTGVGGFALDECARLMVAAARAHEPRSLRHVVFAVYGAEAAAVFRNAL